MLMSAPEVLPPYFAATGYEATLAKLSELPSAPLPSSDLFVGEVTADGEVFVVREPRTDHMYDSDEEADAAFTRRVVALRRGIGTAGLEQLVGYSLDERKIVTRHAPGREISQLGAEDIGAIRAEHLTGLFATVNRARQLDLAVDNGSADNILFDPIEGFTIIDYAPLDPEQSVSTLSVGVLSGYVLRQLVEHCSTRPDETDLQFAWVKKYAEGFRLLRSMHPRLLDEVPPIHLDSFINPLAA